MSLNANALANELKNAVEGETDAFSAMSKLGNAIANYLLNNAQLTFVWNGIKSSDGSPDPVTSASGGIVSLTITLTPEGTKNHVNNMSHLANQIRSGVLVGTYNITQGGFSTSPLPMADAPPLNLSMGGEEARDDAFLNLCTQIVNWMKSYAPSAKILGSHGAYTAPPGTGGTAGTFF